MTIKLDLSRLQRGYQPLDHTGPLQLKPGILGVTSIDPGERARRNYDDGGELMESIRIRGILQSLLVLRRPGKRYLLVSGGRRFFCALHLGLVEVPVLIINIPLNELAIKTLEMVTTQHRRNLTYDEELKQKVDLYQLSVKHFGKMGIHLPPLDKITAEEPLQIVPDVAAIYDRLREEATKTDPYPELKRSTKVKHKKRKRKG